MASSTIKKHLTSDEEIQLPTYKKLPPITNLQKMQGRKTISPTAVSVDFSPPSTVQSRPLLSGKTPVRKQSVDSLKSESAKSPANQNTAFRRSPVIGGKPSQKTNGDVASDQSANGIELVGFKMSVDSGVTAEQSAEWTPYGSELPPCRVCGDKASGLHYGVNTCEACKAFFRRTLKKSRVDFQCLCTPEQKALGTDQPRKMSCPKCRYERCIKIGMSKDAIKIGRYSITRKRQNDREVKQMKRTDQSPGAQRNSLSSKSSSSGSPYSKGQSVSSPEELSSDITSLSLQESKGPTRAPKRPHEDDPEDGLLYKSLTNSIFLSLIENQQMAGVSQLQSHADEELTPMEKLLVGQGSLNVTIPTSEIDVNTNGSIDSKGSVEQMFKLNSNTGVDFTLSPMDQLISHQEISVPDTSAGMSPMESLLSAGSPWNPSNHGSSVPLTSGQLVFSETLSFDKLLMSQVQNGSPQNSAINPADSKNCPHLSHNNIFPLQQDSVLHSAENIPGIETDIPSPMERLLMSPSAFDPIPPATMTQSPEQLSQHGSTNQTLSDIKVTKCITAPAIDSSTLNATGCYEEPEEFAGIVSSDDSYIENPEEIEIQSMQLHRFENPALVIGKDISLGEIVDIIAELRKAAVVLFDDTKKVSCEEIKKRHAEYLEQYTLKMKVFGDMSNISKEEYLEFYNQTGIDIDNRQQILIEALKYLEESIAKLVKFAKAIPGFSMFDIDDQVSLVKVSRFEHDMIKLERNAGCILNPRTMVTTTPWDKDYHINEISKVLPVEFVQAKVKAVKQLGRLGLTYEESVILKAIVITFPDRCSLKEPQKVENIHNRLIACFLFMLNQRSPANAVSVKRIMGTLFKLRELAIWDTQIVQEMFEVWPVSSNHQLLKEFVS